MQSAAFQTNNNKNEYKSCVDEHKHTHTHTHTNNNASFLFLEMDFFSLLECFFVYFLCIPTKMRLWDCNCMCTFFQNKQKSQPRRTNNKPILISNFIHTQQTQTVWVLGRLLLMLSQHDKEDNCLTKLLESTHPAEKRQFIGMRIDLRCRACKRKKTDTIRCTHLDHLYPEWLLSSDAERANILMEGDSKMYAHNNNNKRSSSVGLLKRISAWHSNREALLSPESLGNTCNQWLHAVTKNDQAIDHFAHEWTTECISPVLRANGGYDVETQHCFILLCFVTFSLRADDLQFPKCDSNTLFSKKWFRRWPKCWIKILQWWKVLGATEEMLCRMILPFACELHKFNTIQFLVNSKTTVDKSDVRSAFYSTVRQGYPPKIAKHLVHYANFSQLELNCALVESIALGSIRLVRTLVMKLGAEADFCVYLPVLFATASDHAQITQFLKDNVTHAVHWEDSGVCQALFDAAMLMCIELRFDHLVTQLIKSRWFTAALAESCLMKMDRNEVPNQVLRELLMSVLQEDEQGLAFDGQ